MQGAYTRTDLLAALMAERGRWDELLDEIDIRRMDQPEAIGQWSIKLVIAHVMGWERWAAEQAREVARGEPANPGDFAVLDFDAINERFVTPYRDRPPSEVRAESDEVFSNLVGSVERLTPEQLDVRGRAPWSPDQTIGQVVAESSFLHYPEHMEEIREWLEREQR
jgi:hypothetical protein